jgi:putative ABC transport system permease protein
MTGFSIAWGIFILIVLLGAGNGFRSGMLAMFSGYASNSIWITGSSVSKAINNGLPVGSQVWFDDVLLKKAEMKFAEILETETEISLPRNSPITYKNNPGWFEVKGISENYMNIKSLEVEKGRLLNRNDYIERRRCLLIGERVVETLFGNEEPVGKFIQVEGVMFQVIGVLKGGTIFSLMEQNSIYTTSETLFYTFNLERRYATFGAILHPDAGFETFEGRLREFLAQTKGFDKDDRRALYINNIQLQVKSFNMLFDGINKFLWVLGLCFILSGMIGVTNIMLVVVNERREEIGIRKAVGATPSSILELIISEAILLTFVFGVIGMACGFAGMSVYNYVVSALQTGQQEIFAKATIDSHIVIIAFVLLIAAGVFSGLFPAQKAAKILPVEILSKVV